jgi:hypothetical protein
MNIEEIKHLEDCFDGSFIKEIMLSEPISRDFILYLGQEGTLQYFATFARPFFKIVKQRHYELKGVEGDQSIRILLKDDPEETLQHLKQRIADFKPEKTL